MDRNVQLLVDVAVDAGGSAAELASVGTAAAGMADDVARAARDADAATSGLADSVDGVGSSSAQAAGGIGDLGGALSMMPGPLGAVGSGMETVAPLIMGVTGAADLMSLAMNSTALSTVRAKVATASHAVTTTAATAATKAATAGQWALNAALSANPVGLVVLAIAALVAGLVLAYKKSETFRNIVDTGMGSAKDAIGWVVDKVDDLGPAFDLATTPLRTVIGLVEDLVGWLGKIDIPDFGDLKDLAGKIPGFGRVYVGPAGGGGGGDTYYVTLNGVLDGPDAVRRLEQFFQRAGAVRGRPVVVAG